MMSKIKRDIKVLLIFFIVASPGKTGAEWSYGPFSVHVYIVMTTVVFIEIAASLIYPHFTGCEIEYTHSYQLTIFPKK